MSDIIVEPFILDHYRAMGGENLRAAIINQISGPAYTLIKNGQILACGGVRTLGIGEAWAAVSPEASHHGVTIVKTARAVLDEIMKTERLYCLFAYPTVDKPNWFKLLGFHRENLFVR